MKRVVLAEGSSYSQPIPELAKELGTDSSALKDSLYAMESYLCKRLSLSSVMRIERDKFRFERIAGIFPISDQLEIEIVPKFMTENEFWRTAFLLLLARSRWGMLAERQMVAASKSEDRSINDALGLVFLTLFDSVSRVPIRTYKRRNVTQLQIEGDLDEESLLLPEPDGFSQMLTEFTSCNVYNAVICEAADTLMKASTDFDLQSRLARVELRLGRQEKLPSRFPKVVPSRFRNWGNIYALSCDILDGYGIDYINQGDMMTPSFVVRTADAWEEFLRQALVSGLPTCNVAFQQKYPFARRDNTMVKVRPDYVLHSSDGGSLLVDAKYKYADATQKSISNSDIYEGWAFMAATGIPKLILLYPYVPKPHTEAFSVFSHVKNDEGEILGVRVNPEMAATSGMSEFAEKLGGFLLEYFL